MSTQKVIVKKLTLEEILVKDILEWPIATKEASVFEWYYETQEECLIIEGEVMIDTPEIIYYIRKGDFVIFPKGLKCTWYIKEAVSKHYRFS